MGNIKFELRKIKTKDEPKKKTKVDIRRIYLISWVEGVRFAYSTGEKIDFNEWNEKDQRAIKRKGRNDLALLNSLLKKYEERLRAAVRELKDEGKEINNKNLKQIIDRLTGRLIEKKKYTKLVPFGEDVKKRYEKMNKFPFAINSTVGIVKKFRPNVTFDEIDVHFHDDLVTFMMDEKLNKVKEYTKNYIAKTIATIKLLMNLAVEEGYTKNQKHKSSRFKVKKELVYNIYLSIDELEILHKHKFKFPYLDNACDLFLLGAFTGLRFGDFTDLKGVNFTKGEFIIQDAMKVSSRLVIPQHRIVKKILKKRKGELPHSISNVKLNKYLKEIGKAAKIKEKVIKTRTEGGKKVRSTFSKYELMTTHTARRSLATNMYLAGIPIKTIMTITGHSSVAQLMEYIKITEIEVAESLKDHPFFK